MDFAKVSQGIIKDLYLVFYINLEHFHSMAEHSARATLD